MPGNRVGPDGGGIRLIGGSLAGYGAYKLDSFDGMDPAGLAILAGSVAVVVSAIGDIARADGSARRHNEQRGLTGYTWQPGLLIGEDAVGIHVTVRW